jgi:hypothetical protein
MIKQTYHMALAQLGSQLGLKKDLMPTVKAALLFLVLAHPQTYTLVSGLTKVTGTNLLYLHSLVFAILAYLLL